MLGEPHGRVYVSTLRVYLLICCLSHELPLCDFERSSIRVRSHFIRIVFEAQRLEAVGAIQSGFKKCSHSIPHMGHRQVQVDAVATPYVLTVHLDGLWLLQAGRMTAAACVELNRNCVNGDEWSFTCDVFRWIGSWITIRVLDLRYP